MGGKASRVKGHTWERSVAIKLRERLDPHARRNVSETQEGTVDIETSLPLGIQCKALKSWALSPTAIYAQAAIGTKKLNDRRKPGEPEKIPVGIVKINRKSPSLVLIALDHFLDLLEVVYGKKEITHT